MTADANAPLVRVRVPAAGSRSATEVIAELSTAPRNRPFDEVLIDFVAEFARRLGRSARGYGELQALAFWMRRAELTRMRADFEALATERTLLMPRGVVFHVPPANVDTIFIYSWLLSLLVGNANVVRLSSRSTAQTELILGIVGELVAEPEFAAVAASTAMVEYGHDDATTAILSAAADLRVIWGGDATVRAIRRAPLAPHAADLTFPDRVSLAAISAAAVVHLDDVGLQELAKRFYNDAYWFNQLGCSSPRTVVWVGDEETTRRAEDRFFQALHGATQTNGLIVEPGIAIAKLTHGYSEAASGRGDRVRVYGSEVLVVSDQLAGVPPEDFIGGGMFHSSRIAQLRDIAPTITRRHQTLSHFGFEDAALYELVDALGGRGLDRLVPVGESLTFNRYWDGNDLFQSFSRRVYVEQLRAVSH